MKKTIIFTILLMILSFNTAIASANISPKLQCIEKKNQVARFTITGADSRLVAF